MPGCYSPLLSNKNAFSTLGSNTPVLDRCFPPPLWILLGPPRVQIFAAKPLPLLLHAHERPLRPLGLWHPQPVCSPARMPSSTPANSFIGMPSMPNPGSDNRGRSMTQTDTPILCLRLQHSTLSCHGHYPPPSPPVEAYHAQRLLDLGRGFCLIKAFI